MWASRNRFPLKHRFPFGLHTWINLFRLMRQYFRVCFCFVFYRAKQSLTYSWNIALKDNLLDAYYIDGQDNIYPISNFLTNAASPTKPPPNYSNKSPTEFPPKPILFAMCSYNPISIRLRNLLGQTTMQMRREMSASHRIDHGIFSISIYREEEERN